MVSEGDFSKRRKLFSSRRIGTSVEKKIIQRKKKKKGKNVQINYIRTILILQIREIGQNGCRDFNAFEGHQNSGKKITKLKSVH